MTQEPSPLASALTAIAVIATVGLMAGMGCSGGRDMAESAASEPSGRTSGGEVAATSSSVERPPTRADTAVLDDGPPLSEAAARAVLARRFRAAGFRIRADVRLRSDGPPSVDLTVDGYDPAARVGFEYIDASERGRDLSAAERNALTGDPDRRILVIDSASRAHVMNAADTFLGAIERR
ncbi:MAG: hypothetical protein AAGC55_00795 [Myxococcota bacterium]